MDMALMTIKDAAEYCRVTTDGIYLWRYTEWFPIFSIQPPRYEKNAANEWLQKRPIGGYKEKPDLDCYSYCTTDPKSDNRKQLAE